jgi:hypothetical protein
MRCDDNAKPRLVKLWAASSSKYLQYVKNPQINKWAMLCIIEFCPLEIKNKNKKNIKITAYMKTLLLQSVSIRFLCDDYYWVSNVNSDTNVKI